MPRRVLVVLALLVLGLIGVGVTTAVNRSADDNVASQLEEPEFELPAEDPSGSPTPLSTDNPADVERSESPTPQVTGVVGTSDPSASPDATQTATAAPASPDAQPSPTPDPPSPDPTPADPAPSATGATVVPLPEAPSTPQTGAPVALAVGGLVLVAGAIALRRHTRG